jgi:outer membrane protein
MEKKDMNTRIIKTTMICAMMLLISGISIFAAEQKIGFVDFEKVFNSYKRTRDENQKLQRVKEEKEKTAQGLIDEINKLKAEAEILSDDAKKKVEKDIMEKLRSLRDFTDDSKKELLDERNVLFQKITDEIRQVIAAKGKMDHFTLILDDKALFYKESALDLTEEIIVIVNDDAKKAEILKQKG